MRRVDSGFGATLTARGKGQRDSAMNFARSLLAGLALTLLAAAPAAAPRHYRIDPAASEVSARVSFFGLSSKTARFPKLSGGIVLDPADREAIDLDVIIDARALHRPR